MMISTILVNGCTGTINPLDSVCNFLTSPYTSWFPVVISAVLAIISVFGILYALSPLMGRSDIRNWIRIKIYELLLSIVLILIFAAFSTSMIAADPHQIFSNFGMVTGSCDSPTVNNFYVISICNLEQFNHNVGELNVLVYYISILSSINPGKKISLGTISFTIGLSPENLNPVVTFFGPLYGLVFITIILNQVQLLILSSSVLVFSILIAIGLIARSFGITRTFGGAMIALAFGIGIIYPILAGITYGIIDYGIAHSGINIPVLIGTVFASYSGIIASSSIASIMPSWATTIVVVPSLATLLAIIYEVFKDGILIYAGFIGIGLTFIPLLNFVIIDTFVLDFSQAIGERLDFISLLTTLV